jgi:hypothetical protein
MQVHLQMPTVNRTNAINAMNKDTQNTPNTQDAKDTPPHHAAPPEGMNVAQLKERAKALRLMGLLAHWEALQGDTARLGWTADLLCSGPMISDTEIRRQPPQRSRPHDDTRNPKDQKAL